MGFSIGSALGAVKDVVTSPFTSDDDKPARNERAQSAATDFPRSSTTPDQRPAPRSGAPSFLSASEQGHSVIDHAKSFFTGVFVSDDNNNNDDDGDENGSAGTDVAVIDDFEPKEDGLNHGGAVESVIENNGTDPQHIQRIQQDSSITPTATDLDGQIEEYGSMFLERTAGSLEEAGQDSDVGTINISSSTSRADVINNLLQNMSPEEATAELGLPPGTDPHILAQALAERVDTVFDNSDKIKTAQANYDAVTGELADRGVTVVVAAGNSGDTIGYLEENNIQLDDETVGDNVLANEDVITVGASDGDDTASFSASRGNVDVTADGTDVETDQGLQNGTSFAAPQVTAAIVELKKNNPDLSNAEIMAILNDTSTNTGADDGLEGAGALNVDRAVSEAVSGYGNDEEPGVAEKAGRFLQSVISLVA